ncbi:tricyclene synthase TPS4, chloroplastic isoform X2 [Lathyrus oleraceus]|nr:tricyclene synthase TPS4, chloroplastic-like isoform X2 [Pisum sativum]
MLQNSSFVSLPSFFKPQQPRSISFPSSNVSLLPCYATNSNISQRKSANYQPNIWDYDTLLSLKHDYADVHYLNRSRRLQEEVRRMINDENVEILELIANVKHLGISYHFEKEIREALDRFLSLEKYGDTVHEKNLHDTALKFKLLREYEYDVSSDIFERFKDHNGNFEKCLVKDVKGMLSLYEASFLSYEGEQILDEANSFTSFHLRGIQDNISNFLFEQVNHSLELPFHRRFQRLEARRYIESYGKRKDANKVLVEAAKLDFNIAQSNLQQDLIEMSSWDINAVETLPEYMKIFFLALYNTVNELAKKTLQEKGHDILPYLVQAWSDMLKAFLQEARWCNDKHMPKFDDYLNNAWVSVSGVVLLTHAYFLLNHSITKEGLEHLKNSHLLLQRPSIIFRLCNDLATSSAELERGETVNSIMCYMKENGVSEMLAHQHINNLLNETWKKMNKDRVTDSTFPKCFLETLTNLARTAHCTYQYGDGHGAPNTISKNRIKALILEPIN